MSASAALAALGYEPEPFLPGHVWLAGAGPGSLGCLTVDVLAALAQADAVVYDALVDANILSAAPNAEHHFVGKRAGQPSTRQDDIDRLLVRLAGAGKRVLRLKGGDPNLFGRGGEEALKLVGEGIPFRFLPGITAAAGALAAAGIPMTMRGVNKAIVLATGHAAGTADDLDWKSLAATGQPVIIYMGMRNLDRIVDGLLRGGIPASMPAAIIMDATTGRQRVLTSELANLVMHAREEGFGAPAIIVVGRTVALREAFA